MLSKFAIANVIAFCRRFPSALTASLASPRPRVLPAFGMRQSFALTASRRRASLPLFAAALLAPWFWPGGCFSMPVIPLLPRSRAINPI